MSESSVGKIVGNVLTYGAITAGGVLGGFVANSIHIDHVEHPIEKDSACLKPIGVADEVWVSAPKDCVIRITNRYGVDEGFGPLTGDGVTGGARLPSVQTMETDTQKRMSDAEGRRLKDILIGVGSGGLALAIEVEGLKTAKRHHLMGKLGRRLKGIDLFGKKISSKQTPSS